MEVGASKEQVYISLVLCVTKTVPVPVQQQLRPPKIAADAL